MGSSQAKKNKIKPGICKDIRTSNSRFKGLTDFQLRVLEETLKIPFGETRTYSWIAKRIGSPHACRAVGSALKKNPYPLIIPCHRVIKSTGDIGGYSRGKLVKKKLLGFEKRIINIFRLNRKSVIIDDRVI